jgi:Protein of unknown function (DUF4240)
MNDNECWNFIDKARAASDESGEFIDVLKEQLSELNENDIRLFKNFVDTRLVELYRWDIWGVAYIVNGGCSDDGFEYFRRWVISQGREFYSSLLKNPDLSFRDPEVTDCECEDLPYAIDEVYESVAGHEMPNNFIKYPKEPLGETKGQTKERTN